MIKNNNSDNNVNINTKPPARVLNQFVHTNLQEHKRPLLEKKMAIVITNKAIGNQSWHLQASKAT